MCVQVDDATVVEMVSVLEKYPITRATLEVKALFNLLVKTKIFFYPRLSVCQNECLSICSALSLPVA